MATVRPAVGTVPLAVRLPAVPQHCAQLQYAVSVKLPRYVPWLEEPESGEVSADVSAASSEEVSSEDVSPDSS